MTITLRRPDYLHLSCPSVRPESVMWRRAYLTPTLAAFKQVHGSTTSLHTASFFIHQCVTTTASQSQRSCAPGGHCCNSVACSCSFLFTHNDTQVFTDTSN